jgi:hypothetical protein
MDYKKFVEELHAMISHMYSQDISASQILFNVTHDLDIVVNDKKGLPRCAGILERLKKNELPEVVIGADRLEEVATESVIEVECPICNHSRRVEPDADYEVECEGCENTYRIRNEIC